jgi:hypothetical protein
MTRSCRSARQATVTAGHGSSPDAPRTHSRARDGGGCITP